MGGPPGPPIYFSIMETLGLEVVILHKTDKKITENIAVKKYLVLTFYPITETY